MSYILEALKKAEAERERERGRVPDLNSQAGPVPWLQAPGRRERSALPWVAVAAPVGAAALWWLLRPVAQPQESVDAVAAGTLAGAPVGPAPATSPMPAGADERAGTTPTTSVSSASPPNVAAPPAQALASQVSVQQTAGQQTAARQAAVARQSDDGVAPRHPAPERALGAVMSAVTDPSPARRDLQPRSQVASVQAGSSGRDRAPAAPAQAASPRVLPLRELPLSVQGELPRLSFGGAMYSEDPASRLLIINGQVFHEGDEVQKGLRLEHIQLKSAVLSYRGYQFLVDY
jgi:general secretion pathway protein B